MKSLCVLSLTGAVLACCGAYAQEKPHSVSVRKVAQAVAAKKPVDAKKGAGTGGYSQAAADRWRATQAAGATRKVTSEAGEGVHKARVGSEGVMPKQQQRKGWVYTGHVRHPHTDAK